MPPNDSVSDSSWYSAWLAGLRSWEWRTTAQKYVDTLPAMGVAVLMIIAAYYGHPAPDPPALYLEMARSIEQAGYGIPTTVIHHTKGGLPFAYPPLAFYTMAVLKDLTPLTYLEIATGMTWVEYVIFALVSAIFARTLFADRTRWHHIVASVLIVVTPAIYFWQLLQPSGSVRLMGQIFLVAGLVYGLRLFRDGERSARLPAVVLFAGTILSHPSYVPFFGVSYLLMYAVYDRSVKGVIWGATVAIGGIVVTAPWWGLIVSRHGVKVFLYAAGTHGGVGARTSVRPLLAVLLPTDGRYTPLRIWSLATIGGLYCLLQRRWFLPLWILITSILFQPVRFIAFVEAFLVTVAVCEVVLPMLRKHDLSLDVQRFDYAPLSRWREFDRQLVSSVIIGVLLLGTVVTGMGFAHTNQRTGPPPAFYDATEWLQEETASDTTIVSYVRTGHVAFYSQRTVLNTPWGAEWKGDGAFKQYKQQNGELRSCSQPACLSQLLTDFGYQPDYIIARTGQLDQSTFDDTRTYRPVYSNQQFVIYKYTTSIE